jgi:hypothetical protein
LVDGFLINRTGYDDAEWGIRWASPEQLTFDQINQQRRPDLIDEMSRLSMLLAELRKKQRDN